jgi:glycosyltransferase involved in cell wall biosynthesis
MKHIWFISKYCRLPGEGVYPARSFSILRVMARRGYDCTLITARNDWPQSGDARIPGREVAMIDGVRVVTLNVLRYHRTKSLRRIVGWLHFEARLLFMRVHDLPKPDVVIASSLSLLSILNGLILKFHRGCLLVFEVRDIWPLVLTENGGFGRYNPFVLALGMVERLGYIYSDRIVGTMPGLGAHVRQLLGRQKDVACIPMGVPEELIADEGAEFPEDLEEIFPKAKFVVTHAGSIGIDNALDTLLTAARLLKDEDGIAFFIVGTGDLAADYKASCADLPRVVFSNPVPNRYVQPVLRRSTALYFAAHPTAVFDYGQSLNKLIDYMYSGRPVLGSYSGLPSMIDEAACGDLVPAGDVQALVRAIRDWAERPSAELDSMGARGRAWVLSNRSYDRLADDYLALLGSSSSRSKVYDDRIA